jgi:hypothetical protein
VHCNPPRTVDVHRSSVGSVERVYVFRVSGWMITFLEGDGTGSVWISIGDMVSDGSVGSDGRVG